MTKKINKRLYYFILLFVSIFGTEIIVKLIRGSNVFSWPTLRILISSVIISYLFGYLFSKLKDKVSIILIYIFYFLVSLYAYLQMGFFRYIGTYMSFNSSSQAYKVTEYIVDFISSIIGEYYLAYVPLGLLIIHRIVLKILSDKKGFKLELVSDKNNRTKWIRAVIKTSILLFMCFIYFLTLIAPFMQSKYQFEKNIDIFKNPENQSVAIEQFGVTVFLFIDINSFFFHYETPIEEIPLKPHEEEPTDYSRVIDDSKWLSVIENENKPTIKQLSNYFISREVTKKNEYTGTFKDKNVIVIMMESVGMLGINEEYFPTLYKLWSKGISFTNFYSPRNSCPTGNNEMTAMVGLYTINNSCTANAYRKNSYPQGIFYKFRELGYSATSYHDYIDHYYYRNDIHTNSGSEKYFNANALKIKVGTNRVWPSDVELFEKGLPNFINDEKFFAFMTSVTAHSPYNISSEFGDKNMDLFDDENITNAMKRYYSKVYELDLGLKYLLEQLESTGKLDDTVIVLFGDHQPYSLGVKQQTDILGEEYALNKNIEKTPFIIYNSQIEPKVVDDYVSIIDVLPTILNLVDANYDPRLYVGEDVFNDEVEHRAIFTDGSWQDEIGFFNASTDKFIPNNPEDLDNIYTDEDIFAINTEINQRQRMSTLAIKNNYFYHLFESLNK